ncbi:MAG: ATP-binding protein [Pseudomonadota bacterium]|nr:ATP-binding protein [Pseudomonadota bacterium]
MNIFRSKYFWRSYIGYVVLGANAIVLLCLLLLINNAGAEREATGEQLRAHAQLLARAAADPLRRRDLATVEALGVSLTDVSALRVTFADAEGLVLVDTHESAEQMGVVLHRPEMQLALTQGVGMAERYSEPLSEAFYYAAVPIRSGETVLGIARVGRSLTDINRAQADRQLQLVTTCFGVLLALMFIGIWPAWRKGESLEDVTQITEAIAQGDFERRVAESRALGMKRLADAINQMARNSARRVATLTAERNRLATIFTGMVEGVIDVDEKQNIVHINEAAAALLGVRRERCMGKPLWQEVRNQKITQALDEALRSRSVIKSRIDYPRESDQLVFDIYVASLADDDGEPIGAVLVLHDVTELKYLERIRTDFVANASHELKTPITAIRGLSETIIGDAAADRATLMRFMERIHAQSIRLSHLVTDLMTISRLESDQNMGDFSLLNFADLVTRAASAAQVTVDARQHRLTVSLPERRVEVYGDRQHLSQLVDNLLDNAIKYTPDKGLIQLRLRIDGADMLFEVEDSGIGISPQYQQRVFERFYRVDKARSQSLGGTGLGLSIVKNIAERHSGNVSVVSQLGVGSIFTFRMPLAQSSVQS